MKSITESVSKALLELGEVGVFLFFFNKFRAESVFSISSVLEWTLYIGEGRGDSHQVRGGGGDLNIRLFRIAKSNIKLVRFAAIPLLLFSLYTCMFVHCPTAPERLNA